MTDVQNIDDTRVEPFGKIIIITLSEKNIKISKRLSEAGLCFTEQYNARVCLGVVPEAFLLADHANNTGCYQLLIDAWWLPWLHMEKHLLYVTEKECKLIT